VPDQNELSRRHPRESVRRAPLRREQLRATLPIGRVVGPADVAALAVHIMANTALTGATFDIDGRQQLVAG
jgi:NAD(P)-dependent dehydrogenase (short-subunit alcohol dehydrogenase family)